MSAPPTKSQNPHPVAKTATRVGHPIDFSPELCGLLEGAADLREDVAGVGADQADGADDDDEDDGEHDRVFGDVLTLLIGPELAGRYLLQPRIAE